MQKTLQKPLGPEARIFARDKLPKVEKIATLQRSCGELSPKQKFDDRRQIIFQFVKKGKTAVELFGWGQSDIPLLLGDAVGREGRVYSIDMAKTHSLELVLDFHEKYRQYANSETNPVSREYMERWSEALGRCDVDRIKSAIRDVKYEGEQKNPRVHIKEFCELMGVYPIVARLPPFPKQIMPNSVDVVIERRGFPFVLDDLFEPILQGVENVLKKGGILILSETPGIMEMVQDCRETILKNFSRIIPEGLLNNPYEWLILRKEK